MRVVDGVITYTDYQLNAGGLGGGESVAPAAVTMQDSSVAVMALPLMVCSAMHFPTSDAALFVSTLTRMLNTTKETVLLSVGARLALTPDVWRNVMVGRATLKCSRCRFGSWTPGAARATAHRAGLLLFDAVLSGVSLASSTWVRCLKHACTVPLLPAAGPF